MMSWTEKQGREPLTSRLEQLKDVQHSFHEKDRASTKQLVEGIFWQLEVISLSSSFTGSHSCQEWTCCWESCGHRIWILSIWVERYGWSFTGLRFRAGRTNIYSDYMTIYVDGSEPFSNSNQSLTSSWKKVALLLGSLRGGSSTVMQKTRLCSRWSTVRARVKMELWVSHLRKGPSWDDWRPGMWQQQHLWSSNPDIS